MPEVPDAVRVADAPSDGARPAVELRLRPAGAEYHAAVAEPSAPRASSCARTCAPSTTCATPAARSPTGVDPERFEVVVNLLSLSAKRRARVRVQVPEADPVVATLFDLYPGTEAMEREAFDLMGIVFAGHPDLTRILMPEDWEGHPLRKDYGVGRVPVQFKEAPGPR